MTPPSGEPVFIRWEHATYPHRKFYEVEVELSLFYPKVLIRRGAASGRGDPGAFGWWWRTDSVGATHRSSDAVHQRATALTASPS